MYLTRWIKLVNILVISCTKSNLIKENAMTQTFENLLAAFAGESQANRKYLAFAERADLEGHPQVARLFRAAAAAETVHAHSHLRVMGGIRSTAENIQSAIEGEHYEATDMYPGFVAEAESANEERAVRTFSRALDVEKIHEQLYREALENLGHEEEEPYEYYVCPVCGFTHARTAPDRCPVCQTVGRRFMLVS
jgi:rubrerythrin